MIIDCSVQAIVIDANILIDFLETDTRIIPLISRHMFPLCIPDIVAAEVSELQEVSPSTLGLSEIETPRSYLDGASSRASSLSVQDYVCMRMAQERGWGCATNDKALRRECRKRGIPVLWGFELMRYLVKKGVLDKNRAIRAAWDIHACNKTITEEIVYLFLAEIDR